MLRIGLLRNAEHRQSGRFRRGYQRLRDLHGVLADKSIFDDRKILQTAGDDQLHQRPDDVARHEETTIAEAVKEAGYRTAHVGKWHLAPRNREDYKDFYPTHHGFDLNIGGGEWEGHYLFIPTRGKKRSKIYLSVAKEGDFLTDRLTDEVLQIIDDWKEDPFFIHLLYAVHTPVMGKPRWSNTSRTSRRESATRDLPTLLC